MLILFFHFLNSKSSQNIFISSLNSWYPIENVINSAYRKVLDFKENAEKILEKEKLETLCLPEFSKAILECKLKVVNKGFELLKSSFKGLNSGITA
jgi:hypothetical protein